MNRKIRKTKLHVSMGTLLRSFHSNFNLLIAPLFSWTNINVEFCCQAKCQTTTKTSNDTQKKTKRSIHFPTMLFSLVYRNRLSYIPMKWGVLWSECFGAGYISISLISLVSPGYTSNELHTLSQMKIFLWVFSFFSSSPSLEILHRCTVN